LLLIESDVSGNPKEKLHNVSQRSCSVTQCFSANDQMLSGKTTP